MIKAVILGEVQSQLRPIFKGKLVSYLIENNELISYKLSGMAIDHKKCREYKEKVSSTVRKYYSDEPLDEALRVELNVYIGVTKSWSKKKKEKALNNEILPTSKKDLDNLAKGVLDGCTGVIWKDDGCIVDLFVKKRYSSVPRAEITVKKISEVD